MQIAMELLFIGLSLFVICAAFCYGRQPEIICYGVFASDGTRLDRRTHLLQAPAPARLPSHISVSGEVRLAFSDTGRLLITGPGHVTIHG